MISQPDAVWLPLSNKAPSLSRSCNSLKIAHTTRQGAPAGLLLTLWDGLISQFPGLDAGCPSVVTGEPYKFPAHLDYISERTESAASNAVSTSLSEWARETYHIPLSMSRTPR